MQPFGLVLAGGQARRMGGGHKPLLPLAGGTLLSSVMGRLAPQCSSVAINAAESQDWRSFGVPVLPDPLPGALGPLAGILAGLLHLRSTGAAEWLVTVPGDTPFIPRDLVAGLSDVRTRSGTLAACATSGGRTHPAVALWSARLAPPLMESLQGSGSRSVRAFQERVGVSTADWPIGRFDPFFNVNTPDDLAAAERIAGADDGMESFRLSES